MEHSATSGIKGSASSLYADVTSRIIAQIEDGCLPWVQPWDAGGCAAGLPCNAGTGRHYSGINILILWNALFERGYASQRWLTYRQTQALGGSVAKGESGTTICYADRFTPKAKDGETPLEGQDRRQIAFLKRFTVFNIDQCVGLPKDLASCGEAWQDEEIIPQAHRLIEATGADFIIGGGLAYYMPSQDVIQVPRQQLFASPIDWYRTALHELGHWTGHESRLDRFHGVGTIDPQHWYAREELVAEMTSAFLCATLGIVPTVRHADYIGSWLSVLREDNRAIFKAASQASKAADYLLQFMAPPSQEAAA